MNPKVKVSIERKGTRCAYIEFENNQDAEKVYLDLVQGLRHNELSEGKKVKHMLIGKPGVSGGGLTK
jgi:D-Tyr-tRNAtyr deacylase